MDDVSAPADHASDGTATSTTEPETEILEELLVEEISIDGMCGVY